MTKMTPEQEASYALQWNVPREQLPEAAQLEYDRLRPAWERGDTPAARELAAARLALKRDAADRSGPSQPDGVVLRIPRHTVDSSGTTHTFRHPGAGTASGVTMVAVGVAILLILVLLIGPANLFRVSSAWALIFVFDAFVAVWAGIRSLRREVRVRGGELRIRDEVRTRTVRAGEIRAITLRPKLGPQNRLHWTPRVDLTGGRSIWIGQLRCGPANRPPQPDMAAVVDEIRELLGVGTNAIATSEGGQSGEALLPDTDRPEIA